MKPENTRNITITGNLPEGGTALSLDAEATEHLIGLLTDMYPDPEMAVIREYPTNARDANVAAGNHAPIEITLPSDLNPVFVVKDDGVGLSVDDLYNIYAKYGRSTKRETNEAVGMLGLGCKSALTYTDQFTLVARKDGVKATASISRGANGVGTLTVADTQTTNERNGVEVFIPVKNCRTFNLKAEQFFSYWQAGTVLLNGKPPKPLTGLKINDDLMVVFEQETDIVVMGNVPYPANFSGILPWYLKAVARVPIGAVHFTPSRSELHLTPKTEATLATLKDALGGGLKEALERHIEAQPDRATAMREMVFWNSKVPNQFKVENPKYKGTILPTTFKLPQDQPFVSVKYYSSKQSAHNANAKYLYAASYPETLFLTGYDRASFTAGQKKKLLMFCEEKNIHPQNFALLPGAIPSEYKPYIPAEHIEKWETIQAIKLPRANNGGRLASGRIPGSYDMYVDGDYLTGVPASEIDTSNPVFWVHSTRGDYGGSDVPAISRYLARNLDAYTLVPLPTNRIGKFLRDFPMASDPLTLIRSDFTAWCESITADEYASLAIKGNYELNSMMGILAPVADKIDDPDIVAAIRIHAIDTAKIIDREKHFYALIGKRLPRGSVSNPMKPYLLLAAVRYGLHRATLDEAVIYLNASYAARKAAT